MNLFLIHGFRGGPHIPAWYPWLAAEVGKRGMNVYVPQFPDPDAPQESAWLDVILRLVPAEKFPQTIFVGHSLGGVALLRALEQAKTKAAGAILVGAPKSPGGGRPIESFFSKPFDFAAIRSHSTPSICIYSKDDPYVPYEDGLHYAKNLNARLISFEQSGHFEKQETFPAVLNLILDL